MPDELRNYGSLYKKSVNGLYESTTARRLELRKTRGQVDQRLDILMQFVPYDPNDEDSQNEAILKHQLAHTPTSVVGRLSGNVLKKANWVKCCKSAHCY